jgi:hypothetical protein
MPLFPYTTDIVEVLMHDPAGTGERQEILRDAAISYGFVVDVVPPLSAFGNGDVSVQTRIDRQFSWVDETRKIAGERRRTITLLMHSHGPEDHEHTFAGAFDSSHLNDEHDYLRCFVIEPGQRARTRARWSSAIYLAWNMHRAAVAARSGDGI